MTKQENNIEIEQKKKEITNILWSAANSLRGAMDASVFMNYILGSLCYAAICKRIQHKLEKLLNKKIKFDETDAAEINKDADYNKSLLTYWINPKNSFAAIINKIEKGEVDWLSSWKEGFNDIESCGNGKHSLSGLFSSINLDNPDLGITQTDKQNKLKKLLKIINQIKFDEELFEKTEILGDSFEYLIALFATNNGKKAGEFYSPTQVSQILAKIVAFATPNAKDVYDFAMGSGSLLLGAKRELEKNGKVNVNIYGQEKISTTYNLARMNMIIHDVALDYINLVNGDTIENPEYFSGLKHDIIVANPPFNIKAVDKGEVFTHVDPKDIRWQWTGTTPPDSSLNTAFILHGLYTLSDNGCFACIMSSGFLSNSGQEGKIREKIIRVKNYLDAVIQLPKGLFTNAVGVSAAILVFKKNRKLNAKVMFVDATGVECKKTGPKQVLTNESVNEIVDIINHKKEIDETSKLVSLEEIYKNECSLNVSLYVSKKIVKEQIDIQAVNFELERLKKEDAALEKEFKEMEKDLVYNEGENL